MHTSAWLSYVEMRGGAERKHSALRAIYTTLLEAEDLRRPHFVLTARVNDGVATCFDDA